MKKYIKVIEKDSKDNSVIEYFFLSVDSIEYVNVCLDDLGQDKNGKRCYYSYMDLVMRGSAPIRVCSSTDKDTVEWWFNHFCEWLTDENAKFEIFNFDVCEDF